MTFLASVLTAVMRTVKTRTVVRPASANTAFPTPTPVPRAWPPPEIFS